MIRRHHDKDRIGIVAHGRECCDRDGRGRVAGDGFENDRLCRYARAVKLFLDEEAMVVVAQQDGGTKACFRREPAQGCTKKSVPAPLKKINELFGVH